MIMMRLRQLRQKLRQQKLRQQKLRQQHFLSTRRARLRERNNKKHDHLLCTCLKTMGMSHLIKRFNSFNQFIRMSSDKCLLYGPRFVMEYDKLHARIEALCVSTFCVVEYFGPYNTLEEEEEEEEEKGEEEKEKDDEEEKGEEEKEKDDEEEEEKEKDDEEEKGEEEKDDEEEEEEKGEKGEEKGEEEDDDLSWWFQDERESRLIDLIGSDSYQARNNNKHDLLLCMFLVAMRLEHFVHHFDTFNQFIRMSSDQCLRYGPEFVVKYEELHARIEALCTSAFSVLRDFGPDYARGCSAPKGYYEAIASAASSVASTAAAVPGVATSHGKNLLDEAEEAKGAAEKERGEMGEEKEEEEFYENAQRY